MRHRLHIILAIFAIMLPALLMAQETENVVPPVDYRPKLYGLVKARFETSTYNGDMRFNVRNTRLGIRGNATHNMRYAMQMELNGQGKFDILDTYAAYTIGNFDISLGQQQYKFSSELNRGSSGYFANRSFVGKFISSYHYYENGQAAVASVGARDIGVMLQYGAQWKIPVTFNFGVFNGTGINNAKWQDNVNLVGRVDIGGKQGFQVSGSYYTGKTPRGNSTSLWGAEARYRTDRLIVESEVAMRYLKIDGGTDVMTTGVVQAMYAFPLPANVFAQNLIPQIRWDIADNIGFMNLNSDNLDRFDGQRVTVGLVLGLTEKLLSSEIRLNYEHYFPKHSLSDINTNPLFQNKFTIEFYAKF